ncbi:MAG: DUF4440 domain-containing protein [Steroidobacteraceae bacterium]
MKPLHLIRAGIAIAIFSVASLAQAQTEVRQLADKWTEAYNKHDRNAISALYTQDAHLYLHGSPTVKGSKAITDYWAEDFKQDNPLTLLTVTNFVEGVDMILVHGNYEVINRDDGKKVGFGRFAHIWIKDDKGEWRLDRDLWNQP